MDQIPVRVWACPPFFSCRCSSIAEHGVGISETPERNRLPAPRRHRTKAVCFPCSEAIPVRVGLAAPKFPGVVKRNHVPLIRESRRLDSGLRDHGGLSGWEPAAVSKADGAWHNRAWGSGPQPSSRRRRQPACRTGLNPVARPVRVACATHAVSSKFITEALGIGRPSSLEVSRFNRRACSTHAASAKIR
jgi:hypothetical protein